MITGRGTDQVLPGRWLKKMQETIMVPRFKQGEFGRGLVDGMHANRSRQGMDRRDLKVQPGES